MSFNDFLPTFKALNSNWNYSKSNLESIRLDLENQLASSNFKNRMTIVVTGSYGRYEASDESDLDLFWFVDADVSELTHEIEIIEQIIKKYTKKETGTTGTFGSDSFIKESDLLSNIGGAHDTNISMTRRMLFLLEGTWLYGEDQFKDIRNQLLEKYIKDDNSINRLSRFLLNDIIRYYRTITTDFENKVAEGGKSWGLRNIKLKFSRKILYFGGIIAVAETIDSDISSRRTIISSILDKPILERIWQTNKHSATTHQLFNSYNSFIDRISTPENRTLLESVTKENRDKTQLYVELRDESEKFSQILEELLKEKYNKSILHALVF